jgi:hypothetical protein
MHGSSVFMYKYKGSGKLTQKRSFLKKLKTQLGKAKYRV